MPPAQQGSAKPLKRYFRCLLWSLPVVAALYAATVGTMLSRQESLLFYPLPLPQDYRFDLPHAMERQIVVPGARLSAIHLRLPHAKGLVFYLHGNAGNLATWLPVARFYRDAGFDFFMPDYRGFGKSTGRIGSEAELHADMLAAWQAVAGEYTDRPIILIGRSLGSGLAAELATHVRPAQLILVSPYFSFLSLGRDHFPWVPTSLTRYPMRTDLWLPRVQAPILMLHGARDTLIAPDHALRLKTLRPDARLQIVDGAGHTDIQGFPAYIETLTDSLATVSHQTQ